VGTTLNRVSVETFNPTINISVDELNEKFIQGYTLHLEFPEYIDVVNIVPFEVSVIKDGKKELLYSLDEDGKKYKILTELKGLRMNPNI
jgi:hypothetical protein